MGQKRGVPLDEPKTHSRPHLQGVVVGTLFEPPVVMPLQLGLSPPPRLSCDYISSCNQLRSRLLPCPPVGFLLVWSLLILVLQVFGLGNGPTTSKLAEKMVVSRSCHSRLVNALPLHVCLPIVGGTSDGSIDRSALHPSLPFNQPLCISSSQLRRP
jgi:hypothetical protein